MLHIDINMHPPHPPRAEAQQTKNTLLDACHHVNPPVGLHSPAQTLTLRDLGEEMLPGLCLPLFVLQRRPQVTHVLCGAQLGDACQQHEGEESDQQAGVGAQGQVRLGARVLERQVGHRTDREEDKI